MNVEPRIWCYDPPEGAALLAEGGHAGQYDWAAYGGRPRNNSGVVGTALEGTSTVPCLSSNIVENRRSSSNDSAICDGCVRAWVIRLHTCIGILHNVFLFVVIQCRHDRGSAAVCCAGKSASSSHAIIRRHWINQTWTMARQHSGRIIQFLLGQRCVLSIWGAQ